MNLHNILNKIEKRGEIEINKQEGKLFIEYIKEVGQSDDYIIDETDNGYYIYEI